MELIAVILGSVLFVSACTTSSTSSDLATLDIKPEPEKIEQRSAQMAVKPGSVFNWQQYFKAPPTAKDRGELIKSVEKLKTVLFTADQRVLFDFMPSESPELSLKQQFKEVVLQRHPTRFEVGSVRREMVSALRRIRDKKSLDRVDTELMLRLGYLIKEDSPVSQ